MRTLILILAMLHGHACLCQHFEFPAFAKSAINLDNYLPPNWLLKDSTSGDLNGDNLADLALVAELKDTIQELRPDSTINTGSPRVFLILVKNEKTGEFDLMLQNNTFITRFGEGGMNPDAYDKVSITDHVLTIFFSLVRGHAEYKFRYQQGDFYLIGATTGGISGGDIDFWDINFSTKRAKHEWGSLTEGDLKSKLHTVTVEQLRKLRDMSMIFTWEVLPGVFI